MSDKVTKDWVKLSIAENSEKLSDKFVEKSLFWKAVAAVVSSFGLVFWLIAKLHHWIT